MTREITIETTETILSRHGSSITASSCPQCKESSRFVPFAEVVSTCEVDPLTLHRWLNEGRVHFQVSERGGLAICWNTLSALLDQLAKAAHESPIHFPETLPQERRIERTAAKDTRTHSPGKPS